MLVHEYYCRSTLVENTFVLFHFLPDYLVEHRTHNIYDYQTLQKKEHTKDTGDGDIEERRTIKGKGKFLRKSRARPDYTFILILAPANDMLRETKEDDIQYERLSIITRMLHSYRSIFY